MPLRLTVSPLHSPRWLRWLPWRAWVACTLALGLFAVAACGDTTADPIVRATGGGGGNGGNDGSAGKSLGNGGDLCAPCGSRADCNDMESCVQLTRGASHFCSHACGNGNGRCPSGYVCTNVDNVSSMECVPETGDCDQVVP